MGNAFVAGLKNEAPHGRDMTNEDRNSEVSHKYSGAKLPVAPVESAHNGHCIFPYKLLSLRSFLENKLLLIKHV